MPQGGATFVLELGPNVIFSWKFEGHIVCAHDLDHLGEG